MSGLSWRTARSSCCFENVGSVQRVDLRVIRHREVESPPTREQGTDRPGRFDDPGPGRSAAEETDWHRLGKERFAKDLAEQLRAGARQPIRRR